MPQDKQAHKNNTNWLFWFVFFVVIGVLVWRWLEEQPASQPATPDNAPKPDQAKRDLLNTLKRTAQEVADSLAKESPLHSEPASVAPSPSGTAHPEPMPTKQDDLTKIEGIGSYYRDLLYQAGIVTFEQLATRTQTDLDRLIKQAGGRRTASTATWAEQAQLAHQADWQALKTLQATLKGGRRPTQS